MLRGCFRFIAKFSSVEYRQTPKKLAPIRLFTNLSAIPFTILYFNFYKRINNKIHRRCANFPRIQASTSAPPGPSGSYRIQLSRGIDLRPKNPRAGEHEEGTNQGGRSCPAKMLIKKN